MVKLRVSPRAADVVSVFFQCHISTGDNPNKRDMLKLVAFCRLRRLDLRW
jgi:hypothetical protein